MTGTKQATDELKHRFAQLHGGWDPRWDTVLDLDPDFFAAYLDLAAAARAADGIDARTRELLLLAVNAQTTTLHEPGIRAHMAAAIRKGATFEEIFEVLQLVSLIGMHSIVVGMPIMLEELAAAGKPVDVDGPLDARREEVKARFVARRGYWSDRGRPLLMLDPDFFEHYANLSSLPWEQGCLPPKTKEFVYIAIDAAVTHLYEPGLRLHIQNAMRYGATANEIMEVLQLVSTLGMNSCTVGSHILAEESAAAAANAPG